MVNRCCYFLPPDVGVLVLGVCTLIISLVLEIYSIVILEIEHRFPSHGSAHIEMMTHLKMDSKVVKIVLSIMVMVEVLWMFFSVMLIVGLRKNRASHLLSYFSFGIVVAILMLLGGLLVMLSQHWILSIILFISAAIYIHGLIVVYHTYEEMQHGRLYNEYCDDEAQLWNPEDNGADTALAY